MSSQHGISQLARQVHRRAAAVKWGTANSPFDAVKPNTPQEKMRYAKLRLASVVPPTGMTSQPDRLAGQPMTGPDDPRWVLAVRTAEQLQGDILAPDKREKLQRVGKLLGLTSFDISLVIAIVQDQARRGYAPEHCPTAGQAQLCMVGLPRHTERHRRVWATTFAVAVVITCEIFVLGWMLTG